MPLYEFDGKAPDVHPTAFVAPTATLVGEVIVEEGASVWYGARIGARTMVAAHSLVAANAEIPAEVLAAGSPAVVKRPITGTPAEFWVQTNPSAYADLAQRHRQLVRPVSSG